MARYSQRRLKVKQISRSDAKKLPAMVLREKPHCPMFQQGRKT